MQVPIVTVSPQHMHNMIDLALRLTHGLSKCVPDFASLESTIAPDERILAAPWPAPA